MLPLALQLRCIFCLGWVRAAFATVAQDTQGEGISLGVLGPFTVVTQDDLATAVLFDLDFRKNWDSEVRQRFGEPIIKIPSLHPDLSIKLQISTSDGSRNVGVEAALDWFLGLRGSEKVVGIVGGLFSSVALAVAPNAEVFNVPQVAYGSTAPHLSDKAAYPMFLRTIPPDSVMGAVIWEWMNQFRVPSMTFFYRKREAYGEGLLQATLDSANSAGQSARVSGVGAELSGTTEENTHLEMAVALRRVRTTGSKFIMLAIAGSLETILCLYAMEQVGMLYNSYQVVGADALELADGSLTIYTPSRGFPAGTQRFAPMNRGPLYSEFFRMWKLMTPSDVYSSEAWNRYKLDRWQTSPFNASTAALTLEDFQGRSPWIYANFLFDACYTYVIAINNLLNADIPVNDIVGTVLLEELKRTNFEGVSGRVTFDANSDRIGGYELANVLSEGGELQMVALYTPSEDGSGVGRFIFMEPAAPLTWAAGIVSELAPAELVACAPGERWDEFAQLCIFCQENYYSLGGVFEEAQCTACEAGRNTASYGATACMDCVAGTYRPGGDESCWPCPMGTFAATPGLSACTDCPVGEYAPEPGLDACVPCSFGTTLLLGAVDAAACQCGAGSFEYSDAEGLPQCRQCTEYMEPCLGGREKPHQLKGFHITVDGLKTFRCASDNACPGGLLGECPTGSSGGGCATCVPGAYYWDGEHCEKCTRTNNFLVAAMPLLMVLAFLVVHYFGNDPLGKSLSTSAEFVVLVGLAFNIVLYMSAFDAIHVSWKEPILSVVDFSSVIASAEVLALPYTCSVELHAATGFAVTSSMPLLILSVCVLMVLLKVASPHKLFNTVGNITYAFFLLVVLHALKPFRYIVHPSGTKSLLAMPEIVEGSDEHTSLIFVGILVLLFYCVTFLAACGWASWAVVRCPDPESRLWYLECFRFLFFKFRPEAFYWGILVLVRNTVIASAPCMWPKHPIIAVFTLAVIAVVSAAHTAFVCPWKRGWMNFMDVSILSYMSLVLHLAAGWIDDEDNIASYFATALATVAAVAALMLLLITAKLLLSMLMLGRSGRDLRREALRNKELLERQASQQFFQRVSTVLVHDYFHELAEEANNVGNPQAQQKPWLEWINRQQCDMDLVHTIVKQMRAESYTADQFLEDCLAAFPELQLYCLDNGKPDAERSRQSLQKDDKKPCANGPQEKQENQLPNGISSADEQKRTYGALLAVYWVCRLDLDGKRGLSFGVDSSNGYRVMSEAAIAAELEDDDESIPWPKKDPRQRQLHFYRTFNWQLFTDLFQDGGILRVREEDGSLELDTSLDGRLVAMLSLTAYHDIMKDPKLCPTVRGEPYEGFGPGEEIFDHDLALAYVLDRSPELLPSFAALNDEQRRAVRFTQSEMGFNAGWLVQAEGPPSAVLGKLKKAVLAGSASKQDVGFYFVHWVTDLAGAEPTPYNGSEKFAVKFPPVVLCSLLSCFNIVDALAVHSETEVYEFYLAYRWQQHEQKAIADSISKNLTAAGKNLNQPEEEVEKVKADSPSELALASDNLATTTKRRLACMAQQNAVALLEEFDKISAEDRRTLTYEMAETGCPSQEFSEWKALGGPGEGTPFLLYYGPAWCQRAGQSHPKLCLEVLAAVYRAARIAFPESVGKQGESEQVQGVGSRTIQVGLLKTLDLDELQKNMAAHPTDLLRVVVKNSLEGELEMWSVLDV